MLFSTHLLFVKEAAEAFELTLDLLLCLVYHQTVVLTNHTLLA
jgi:hypothetical protein